MRSTSLAFNWLIAGTDAHAKNYSVLIGAGGVIRLAPLYDVASFLPYAGHGLRKLKLAMKIGGKYRLSEIGAHQWSTLADELGRDSEAVRAAVARMSSALPDHASTVLERARKERLARGIVPALADAIQKRARACAKALERADTSE